MTSPSSTYSSLDIYGNKSPLPHSHTLSSSTAPKAGFSNNTLSSKQERQARAKILKSVQSASNRERYKSLSRCSRMLIPFRDVTVLKNNKERLIIKGVQKCRSVFLCPVCQQIKSRQNGHELYQLLDSTHELGGDAVQVTLTLLRSAGQPDQ